MRLLLCLSILNIFCNIRTLSLQTQILTNENHHIPRIINKLKINNDNVFTQKPDLSILNEEFILTINGTSISNKQKYNFLYQNVRACKQYISRDTEIYNTFEFIQDKQYILSNSLCNFNFRFFSKPMKVTIDSKYSFDENYQVIQHDIENIEINGKKINISTLIINYMDMTDNESFIGFLTFVFVKSY